MRTANSSTKIKLQFLLLLLSIVLCAIKMVAYLNTSSNAILSDALESIVNIITGGFGLYAIILSTKPRDEDHPYGHGRIELISSGVEGTLIFAAGIGIGYQAVLGLINANPLISLEKGIPLVILSALLNFAFGSYALIHGRKSRSLTLEAGGQHLLTDAYTTFILLLGLLLIKLTGFYRLDSIMALILSLFILINSIKILRKSISGIMDEVDEDRINEVVSVLERNRQINWIDIHNLRIIKYGDTLHLDCHVTLPKYFLLTEAHEEVNNIEVLLKNQVPGLQELFVHADPCIPECCKNCAITNCKIRSFPYVETLPWSAVMLMKNKKHSL